MSVAVDNLKYKLSYAVLLNCTINVHILFRNMYSCPQQPRHMSVAVDKFKYKLPYASIFGGVTAIGKEHFK
jgi:hypothetical protein